MLKRLASIVVLLAILFAAGIVGQSCRSGAPPNTIAQPRATPQVETLTGGAETQPRSTATVSSDPRAASSPIATQPTAVSPANRSVVWVLDGANYAVAVDTQTGETQSRTPRLFSYFWFYSAHDARWTYYLQTEQKDNVWQIGLVRIDRERGEAAPTIALETLARVSSNELDAVWFPDLFVSPDRRQVLVILAAKIDAKWVTRVYIVDLAQRAEGGRTVGKVSLGKGLYPSDLTYHRLSSHNKLLYILSTSTNQVFAVDLEQRTLLRQAQFKDKTSFASPLQWLAQQLVNTASAKMVPEPSLVLSRDGQRLYFVDVEGLESSDGIWGVDTATLKPLGHWLKGKDIIGLELSADGRGLYAVDWKERNLYVLDAFSGELRLVFEVMSAPSGLVSTE